MHRSDNPEPTDDRRRAGERGFTLIELLVVVAVLGILAAVAILGVSGITSRAHNAACVTDEGTFQTALELHYADTGNGAATLAALAAANYIGGPGISGSTKTTPSYVITYTPASPLSSGPGTVVGTLTGGGPCA